jgi:hypothetical protein
LEQVRRDTYDADFGQSSWVTRREYRRFFHHHVLDRGRLLGFQADSGFSTSLPIV